MNVQRREVLYEAPQLIPLLDASIELVHHLDSVHDLLVPATDDEHAKRAAEIAQFLGAFR